MQLQTATVPPLPIYRLNFQFKLPKPLHDPPAEQDPDQNHGPLRTAAFTSAPSTTRVGALVVIASSTANLDSPSTPERAPKPERGCQRRVLARSETPNGVQYSLRWMVPSRLQDLHLLARPARSRRDGAWRGRRHAPPSLLG